MEVQQEFGDQVRIVGIPGLSDAANMAEFVAETGTDVVPHIPDEDGEIWARFEVTRQRTYVYIDDDGTWRTSGYGSLRQDVQDLIAQ